MYLHGVQGRHVDVCGAGSQFFYAFNVEALQDEVHLLPEADLQGGLLRFTAKDLINRRHYTDSVYVSMYVCMYVCMYVSSQGRHPISRNSCRTVQVIVQNKNKNGQIIEVYVVVVVASSLT